MKTLKPTSIEASFEYVCPHCGSSRYLTLQEASTPGFIVVCYCGAKYNIAPVVRYKIFYGTDHISTPLSNFYQENSENHKKIIDTLSQVGYNKGILEKIVGEFPLEIDVQEGIRQTLSKIRDKYESY